MTFVRSFECPRCLDIHPIDAVCEPADMTPPSPLDLELHLNPDPALPKKYGAKIKALVGGRYSEARGDRMYRIVHIPIATEAGRDLAAQLLVEFGRGKTTVLVRYGVTPGWEGLHRVSLDQHHTIRTSAMTVLEAREVVDKMIAGAIWNWRRQVGAGALARTRVRSGVTWRGRKYHPDDANKLLRLQDQLVAVAAGEPSEWGHTEGDNWHRTLDGVGSELRAVAERWLADPADVERAA